MGRDVTPVGGNCVMVRGAMFGRGVDIKMDCLGRSLNIFFKLGLSTVDVCCFLLFILRFVSKCLLLGKCNLGF